MLLLLILAIALGSAGGEHFSQEEQQVLEELEHAGLLDVNLEDMLALEDSVTTEYDDYEDEMKMLDGKITPHLCLSDSPQDGQDPGCLVSSYWAPLCPMLGRSGVPPLCPLVCRQVRSGVPGCPRVSHRVQTSRCPGSGCTLHGPN